VKQPNLKSARAVADVTRGMLLASVEIMASPERVFRALASEDITKWWGSDDTYRTTRWAGDVRVGGAWVAEGMGSDGAPFSVHGEFLEVDPPRKLVQTWRPSWDGEPVWRARPERLGRAAFDHRMSRSPWVARERRVERRPNRVRRRHRPNPARAREDEA
jgi:uncharacterized protein YndB with AHSA1/START domain